MNLLDAMESEIIPGDGAMGTRLMEAGVPAECCLEELCVSRPELVAGIHSSHLAAGARVIRTNSFGANAVRLAKSGLEKRVNEINWSAAQLARDCVRGKDAWVAGSVGPLGITDAQARERGINRDAIFREQIGALLDGGAHLIFFETFLDVDEMALALYAKQSLHHCPAICSMACAGDGVLPSGMTLAAAFARLRELGADLAGINCVNGPETALRLLEGLPADGPAVAAYPNAGMPSKNEGRLQYKVTPDDFSRALPGLVARGARLIGGCCGTGPEHIAAVSAAIRALASR